MTTTTKTTGFIVTNETSIWGYGATKEAASASFLDEMKTGGIRVVSDDEMNTLLETSNADACTRASGFTTEAATPALIAQVEELGGGIVWGYVDGVACTRAEEYNSMSVD